MARTRKSTARKSAPAKTTAAPTDSRAAAIAAANEASAQRAADATPLEDVQADAQAKGYLGQDAADRRDDGDERELAVAAAVATGVSDAPGGHPSDATTASTSGAGEGR